jgi:Tol biopolymer transport system component
MFFRKLVVTIAFFIMVFHPADSANGSRNVLAKVAFMRDGNVWVYVNDTEIQVSKSGKASGPEWSIDGKLLSYVEEDGEDPHQQSVLIYDVSDNKIIKIYKRGYLPKWSPRGDLLAYKDGTVLNVSDFKRFNNAAIGVGGYIWIPDGSGFILSKSGDLTPLGWTGATLYKKVLPQNWAKAGYLENVEKILSLPNEISSSNGSKIIAVFTSDFSYSPSGRWLSFVVSPTASWSMDSNMVCSISADGRHFEVLDEIILEVGLPKWAPSKDILAFIAGGGRLVFGFKDKDLKTKEFPAFTTYTPENYADLDFAWKDDNTIFVSRIKEAEWSNDLSKHPLPALFVIDTVSGKQTQITSPPEGYADYSPNYIRSADKMIWIRRKYDYKDANIWIANPDGSEARLLLKNADSPVIYSPKL